MYFLNSPRKKILLTSTLIACYMPLAYADFSFQELAPFVGVDYGRARTKLKDKYGGEIFCPNVTDYNFFAGIDLRQIFSNEMFGVGLELGYTRDNNRRDTQSLMKDSTHPGGTTTIKDEYSPTIFNTSMKIRHKYIGITAKYPIFEGLNITALLGMTKTTAKGTHTAIQAGNVPLSEATIQNAKLRRNYKKSKLLPMAKLGLHYEFTKNFALRTNASWIRTSRISIDSKENGPGVENNRLKFKNSILYSVGIVVNFL